MCVENPLRITSVFPTEMIANGIIKTPEKKIKELFQIRLCIQNLQFLSGNVFSLEVPRLSHSFQWNKKCPSLHLSSREYISYPCSNYFLLTFHVSSFLLSLSLPGFPSVFPKHCHQNLFSSHVILILPSIFPQWSTANSNVLYIFLQTATVSLDPRSFHLPPFPSVPSAVPALTVALFFILIMFLFLFHTDIYV